ncbi:MAG: type II toxin-antitoxin system Phd/YefM family antitoxin [Solirubrobacterales bacterium]
MTPKREIPQRELRNNVAAVLRQVEAGESLRVTVRGRPVADLVPLVDRREHLTPSDVQRIVREAPLDAGFAADLESVAGATIDEL